MAGGLRDADLLSPTAVCLDRVVCFGAHRQVVIIVLYCLAIVPSFVLLLAGGCSRSDLPSLAPVSGTVTLDGKPLKQALVTFRPAKNRASRGRTDGEGHYELLYSPGNRGAKIGNHTVIISVRTELDPVERIPAKYNSQTTLTREVKKGKNVLVFDLKSP